MTRLAVKRAASLLFNGSGRRALLSDLEKIAPPSSPQIAAAEALAARCLPAWACAHSLRTFYWGSLLALVEGSRPEPHILYLACLLHDLGFAEDFRPPPGACFAVHGAEKSLEFLLRQGLEESAAARTADAVCLHLNAEVTASPEARALNRGAALDVVGLDLDRIAPPAAARVLELSPRQGMKDVLCRELQWQARNAPRSRMALLARLGFLGLIRKAPFRD